MNLPTLKAEMLERFGKRFLIIRARGKGENKFRPVLYADNEQQENLEKITDFLSTSIDQAFAAGREAGIGEAKATIGPVLLPLPEQYGDSCENCEKVLEYEACQCSGRVAALTALDNLTKPDKE